MSSLCYNEHSKCKFDRKDECDMFHFDRGINKGLQQALAERQAAKQQAREQRAQARQEAWESVAESFNERRNIAVYFNQQFRDVPNYQMSIRKKDGAGSESVYEPAEVLPDMIETIQNNPGLFIEGHARDRKGLVKDIYDADHPDEIRRERYGKRDILKTCDLEAYEQERLASGKPFGPQTRTVMVDNLMDVPTAGEVEYYQEHPDEMPY